MGGDAVQVGTLAALRASGGRMVVKVPPTNRYVAVMESGGEMHCIDATCYHFGGPLALADIEDVGEYGPCITCPWHHYVISLRTGKKLMLNLQGGYYQSEVQRQRIHRAEARDGDVWVTLDDDGSVTSDGYAFKPPAPAQRAMQGPRSGHVLSGGGGLGQMVSQSMHGADGRAPWAVGVPRAAAPAQGMQSALSAAYTRFVVDAVRPAGRNSVLLRFKCSASCAAVLGGGGRHVSLRLQAGGADRPYTPFFMPGKRGEMWLLVKGYKDGTLSPQICSLREGGAVYLRGPEPGGLQSQFLSGARSVVMLAAGTGITPMLQVLCGIAEKGAGALRSVRLLTFNNGEDDVLAREQLEQMQGALPPSLAVRIVHVLTDPPPCWPPAAAGRVSEALLSEYTEPPTEASRMLWCGPTGFNDVCELLAGTLGYGSGQCHCFE
eukprot:TRINITY_DN1093_c0_g1_i1.p1 TRINITY_DN1093_c0_g1~~TRINITY_DN1093_c0_g1_i1.p1  ORF type:complete len:455 (+),score=130.75 TRINITY_DN1093_c0_g1_i1:61-1365(+)